MTLIHFWYLRDTKRPKNLVSAGAGEKTIGVFFVNIESQKPVWQSVIDDRVLCIAPFPEKNVAVGQLFEKLVSSSSQPVSELFPLPRTWKRQIRPSILGTDIPLGVKGEPQIRSVHLFFNDEFMSKEFISVEFRHDFVPPDFNLTKKRQV